MLCWQLFPDLSCLYTAEVLVESKRLRSSSVPSLCESGRSSKTLPKCFDTATKDEFHNGLSLAVRLHLRRPELLGFLPPTFVLPDRLSYRIYYYAVVCGRTCGSRAAETVRGTDGAFSPISQRSSLFLSKTDLPFHDFPDFEAMPLRVDCYLRVFLNPTCNLFLDLPFVRVFKWLLAEDSTARNRVYEKFRDMSLIDTNLGTYRRVRFLFSRTSLGLLLLWNHFIISHHNPIVSTLFI